MSDRATAKGDLNYGLAEEKPKKAATAASTAHSGDHPAGTKSGIAGAAL
jgi:hypothetical protein